MRRAAPDMRSTVVAEERCRNQLGVPIMRRLERTINVAPAKGSAGHEARHRDEACANIFRALPWSPTKCIGVISCIHGGHSSGPRALTKDGHAEKHCSQPDVVMMCTTRQRLRWRGPELPPNHRCRAYISSTHFQILDPHWLLLMARQGLKHGSHSALDGPKRILLGYWLCAIDELEGSNSLLDTFA